MKNHKYLLNIKSELDFKPTKVKCTGNNGYCKWQLLAPIHQYNTKIHKMGPFPGNIDQASFFAFYYDREDVLCLGTF